MTELRKRGAGGGDPDTAENISDKEADGDDRLGLSGDTEGECDGDSKTDTPDVPASTADTDNTPECLNKALEGLPPKWRNYWIRGLLSICMISGFFLMIYMGPIMLIFVVMGVQIKCFQEIITIGYRVYHSYELPWFRTLSW
ncbi:phosphatidate cytidylyltransferase 1-like [Poecilia latipinna]|nr:PREDICTED: phosphatidate cytidylyltransferase 1-like [Poecilia latipinna]